MSAPVNKLKVSPGSQSSSSLGTNSQRANNQDLSSGIAAAPTTITSGSKEPVFHALRRLCASMIKKFMSLVKGKSASSTDRLPASEKVDPSKKVSEFVGLRIDEALKAPSRDPFQNKLVVHLYDGSKIVKTFFYTIPLETAGFKELVQTEVKNELLSQKSLITNSRVRVEVDFFRNETYSKNHPTYGVTKAGYEIGLADSLTKGEKWDEVDFRSGMGRDYLSYYAKTKRNEALLQFLASQS